MPSLWFCQKQLSDQLAQKTFLNVNCVILAWFSLSFWYFQWGWRVRSHLKTLIAWKCGVLCPSVELKCLRVKLLVFWISSGTLSAMFKWVGPLQYAVDYVIVPCGRRMWKYVESTMGSFAAWDHSWFRASEKSVDTTHWVLTEENFSCSVHSGSACCMATM